MKLRQWYRFDAKADDPAVVDLHIVDFIGDWIDDYWGFGVTAKAVIAQLGQLPDAVKTIRVHINSPGGDVWSAINIANALRDQRATQRRAVVTVVDGLAASAASVLMMAGDPVQMADNGLVMIHQPTTGIYGRAQDMRQTADALDKVRDQIVATYKWHSELEAEEIVAMMDKTTWLTADEAIAQGFATEKVGGLQAVASLSASAVAKLSIPEAYRARVAALVKSEPPPPTPPTPAKAEEILNLAKTAGLSVGYAAELVEAALPLPEIEARVARAREIQVLCQTAKLPSLAEGYVRGGMATADVKTHLTTITAAMDKTEIDNRLNPDAPERKTPGAELNVLDVYKTPAEKRS